MRNLSPLFFCHDRESLLTLHAGTFILKIAVSEMIIAVISKLLLLLLLMMLLLLLLMMILPIAMRALGQRRPAKANLVQTGSTGSILWIQMTSKI